MTRTRFALGWALLAGPTLFAFPKLTPPTAPVDLTGYATVDKAVAATVKTGGGLTGPGYLGVAVVADPKGRPMADDVAPNSPAAKAGIKKGDVFTHVGPEAVRTPVAFGEWVQAHSPDEVVKLQLERAGKPIELTVTLDAVSRPKRLGGAFLGITLGERKADPGIPVDRVQPRSPAAAAGVQSGDRILKVNGTDLTGPGRLTDILTEKKPGDKLTLTVKRAGKEQQITATLAVERAGRFGGGSGAARATEPWKKDKMRLVVVPVEFSDAKHNAKVTPAELNLAFFSQGQYTGQNATGQPVSGSLNDYFREQSAGKFHLEGKAVDWVDVGKKRGDYIQGSGTSNKTAVLVDALDKLTARDGADALKDFDAIAFVYAGERMATNRGTVYYPHAGAVNFKQKRIPYLIGPEGGRRLTPIGGFVKQLGNLLGLPDLAARPENAGSKGLGVWCAMSNPFDTARPQDLSAWCKERLGWISPVPIDPTQPQKLVLSPIESAPKECVKVLVRPDGSEYFLLEVRAKKGFDADLPGEGLLVWRVMNDRPTLEESHGVEGPTGPTVHLGAVPFPSPANNSFTPDTTPSSRSPKGGGLPVTITDIRRVPGGRIAFRVGYEFE